MQYTNEQLKEILYKHQKWLNAFEGGERANLSGADLSRADLLRANLSGADLSGADLSRADLSRANLSGANLSGANLLRANLSWADLLRANLSGADLSGANLDYSCLPLHCGLIGVKIDKRIAAQIAYHLLRMTCDDEEVKAVQHSEKIVALAKQFHRFDECGGLPK